MTGIAFGWIGADLGVRLGRQEGEEVVGRLALLDLPHRGPVGPDAGEERERAGLVEREPDVAAFGLVELAEAVNGTTQRFSTPSQRVQCLLLVLRMLVVPPSGSIRSSSLEVDRLALGFQLRGALLGASISAYCDDGMPQRAIASSRPSARFRTIGAS